MVQNQAQGIKETVGRILASVFRVGWPRDALERSMIMYTSFFLHVFPVKVRARSLSPTYSFGLGFFTFFLFIILTITGFFLMFYYIPSTERAYETMQALHTKVTFGTLLRNVHRWAGHAMVFAAFLHMLRVFYTGAYRPPREFNWVIGVILLVVTLLLSYTGYLLVWDQLSFWAVTVGANIAGSTPFIGREARLMLVGSPEISQETLIRFYTLHVIVLPLVAAILMGVHFWRVRKDTFSI